MPEFIQPEIKTVGLGEKIDINELLGHSDDGMTKEEFLKLLGKGSEDEDKKLIAAIEKVFDEKEKELEHSELEEQFVKMYEQDPDSAWLGLITTIMSTGSPEEILEHHGIDGQKWGVRNGPPYPLERQKGSKLSSKQKARILQENLDDLDIKDIEILLKRIELEEKINKLSAEEKKQGNGMVKSILSSAGKQIVSVAVPAVTLYAFKRIVSEVAGDDVLNEMFPKKK